MSESPTRDCEVFHPGVQHSALLAAALNNVDRLIRLTTRCQVGINPSAAWSKLLRTRIGREMLQFRSTALLDDRFIRRRGLTLELASRALLPRMAPSVQSRLSHASWEAFGRGVAKTVDPKTRFLIGTDGASLAAFRELSTRSQRPSLVLDISQPHISLVQELIREDSRENGFPLEDYNNTIDSTGGSWEEEIGLADQIIVASRFSADSIIQAGVTPHRIAVVPYGLSLKEPSKMGRDQPDLHLRLVFIGALSERKGVSLLLEAMAEIEQRRIPATLSLIGGKPGGYSPRRALPANTTYLGQLANEHALLVLTDAHYLVLPSICEGFGRVLIEALQVGTGIIATERSAGPDIRSQHPDAPIEIIPVSRRRLLPDLIDKLQGEVASNGLNRHAALAASRHYSLDRYGQSISAHLK